MTKIGRGRGGEADVKKKKKKNLRIHVLKNYDFKMTNS